MQSLRLFLVCYFLVSNVSAYQGQTQSRSQEQPTLQSIVDGFSEGLSSEMSASPVQSIPASTPPTSASHIWSAEEVREYEEFLRESEQSFWRLKKNSTERKANGDLRDLSDLGGSEYGGNAPEVSPDQSKPNTKAGAFPNGEMFEEAKQCRPERNYLAKQLRLIPLAFRAPRPVPEKNSALPMSCVAFAMRKFFEAATQEPKRVFAYCPGPEGRPVEDTASRQALQPRIDILKGRWAQLGEASASSVTSATSASKEGESASVASDSNEQMAKSSTKSTSTISARSEAEIIKSQIYDLEMQVQHKSFMQPCVTEEYVHPIYNSFIDVADCLNIPEREIVPKLFNESGFHLNAYGAGKDAGIGQLTYDGIMPGVQKAKDYLREMQLSEKPSCKRILVEANSLVGVQASPLQRCGLIAAPVNPLRNLFYTAIYYKESVRQVAGITYKAGQDYLQNSQGELRPVLNSAEEELGGALERLQIREKFRKLGMPTINLHRVKTMLVSLGYNSGTGTAINKLNEYLQERLRHLPQSSRWMLSSKDFDFENISVSKWRSAIIPKNLKSESETEGRQKIAQEEKLRLAQLPLLYANAYQLSFPEFLVLRMNTGAPAYQLFGYPGYLSALAQKNKFLNENFPNGECTAPSYLSL